MSPSQYIQRLKRKVYDSGHHIEIDFRRATVYEHPTRPGIVAVTLQQRWNSPAYADNGYLVLIIEINDEPVIHLRNWYESAPPTGQLATDIPLVTKLRPPALSSSSRASTLTKTAFASSPGSPPATFWERHPRWWILPAAATTAVTLGVTLLTGEGGNRAT
ncbi:hypothetical protein ACG2F4_14845 [Halalkalibaculum sp. DA3122]|uniref:hypothetical protein n=1 Tax=Halalkalibaculum sp. DA3122 TaxID=3373607 RepID=UPI003754A3BF